DEALLEVGVDVVEHADAPLLDVREDDEQRLAKQFAIVIRRQLLEDGDVPLDDRLDRGLVMAAGLGVKRHPKAVALYGGTYERAYRLVAGGPPYLFVVDHQILATPRKKLGGDRDVRRRMKRC